MAKIKLSRWHSVKVTPVHVGVYETFGDEGMNWFSYWDGRVWNGEWKNTQRAVTYYNCRAGIIAKKWRGIVK